jgi:hypothetical protein
MTAGASLFMHACRMGLEGIVSKRLSAPYRSGPSRDWIKVKNPEGSRLSGPGRGPQLTTVRNAARSRATRGRDLIVVVLANAELLGGPQPRVDAAFHRGT